MSEEVKHGFGELDNPCDSPEEAEAHDERQTDADLACFFPVFGWQFVGQDRNEDKVIDAEHDFHYDQGNQGNPGSRILHQEQNILHRRWFLPRWVKVHIREPAQPVGSAGVIDNPYVCGKRDKASASGRSNGPRYR
jgi:hypothetical protein